MHWSTERLNCSVPGLPVTDVFKWMCSSLAEGLWKETHVQLGGVPCLLKALASGPQTGRFRTTGPEKSAASFCPGPLGDWATDRRVFVTRLRGLQLAARHDSTPSWRCLDCFLPVMDAGCQCLTPRHKTNPKSIQFEGITPPFLGSMLVCAGKYTVSWS